MSSAKRVFITGTSAGFGFETTKALAAKGHTVFATMRGVDGKNADPARALARWAKDGGHSVHVLELDVTDEASIVRAVASAVEKGGIDVLIQNAGVGTWGIDEGYTIAQAQRVFDINVLGVMRVNRAVVPHLRQAGKGLIIYVSSGLGRIVFPFMAIYTASKFALEGYAESTSYELAPLGIRSLIVQPGAYGTTFLVHSVHPKTDVSATYGPAARMFEAFGRGFEQRAKSGGLGDPAEVVKALVEEIERPAGERRLRRAVGHDVQEPVSAINATCDQVQGRLLSAFGLK
jgi:NAD(P)-dependent dehydrogenase (short-subunit alcohol dehydrogenase family)